MSQAAVNPRRRYISACAVGCVLAALVTLAAGAPASAGARAREVILINHDKRISHRVLARGARALQLQVNHDLRGSWPGPRIYLKIAKTAAGARWRITLAPANASGSLTGVHGDSRHGPWALVYPSGGAPWTFTASHELLEMLEDPTGNVRIGAFSREVCDPVETLAYLILGDPVSDFVTPAYFHLAAKGPWDYLGQITTAPTGLQVLQGQP